MTSAEIAAAAAVVGLLLGVLRYLVRLAVTVERSSEVSRDVVRALEKHSATSATEHSVIAERLAHHSTRLAVLESRP